MGEITCKLIMRQPVCVLLVIICSCAADSWIAAPYTLVKRAADPSAAAEPQRTRFFTGNNALDAGAAGAALGVGAQYFANQIFNPCTRGGTRGGTRNNNRGTNNRIFGGQTLQNGALGFLAGFAGAALVNNAQGNPCGR